MAEQVAGRWRSPGAVSRAPGGPCGSGGLGVALPYQPGCGANVGQEFEKRR